MVLVGHLFGFTGEKENSFEIAIQFAAIFAVVVLYWKKFVGLIPSPNSLSPSALRTTFRENSSHGFGGVQGLMKLALACGPLFVTGALFGKKIKSLLLYPLPVAIALIFGGVILLFIEKGRDKPLTTSLEQITYRQAFLLGIFQCCALWPGISRSGSMIVGGLLLGMTRIAAAEFSFFVAVPIMAIATLHELWESRHILSGSDLGAWGVGFLMAFLTAAFSIRIFLTLLAKTDLKPFGWYRIALGIVVIAALSLGQ